MSYPVGFRTAPSLPVALPTLPESRNPCVNPQGESLRLILGTLQAKEKIQAVNASNNLNLEECLGIEPILGLATSGVPRALLPPFLFLEPDGDDLFPIKPLLPRP
jgi:hypothetical protein